MRELKLEMDSSSYRLASDLAFWQLVKELARNEDVVQISGRSGAYECRKKESQSLVRYE